MTDNDKQMAKTAMQFLQRVDLKGSEVVPFMAVNNWLQLVIQAPTEEKSPPPPQQPPNSTEH